VNANPKGKDSENETITILNKSKKKINFNGWSIATGWKKLYNHPISGDFKIKSGKEKEITREFSKFTLNNKKAKIELRYPDGEVAYEMKYKKIEGIAEGEIYEKKKGGWAWQQSQKSIKSIKSEKLNMQNDEQHAISYLENIEENKPQDIPDEDVGKQTIQNKEFLLLKAEPIAEMKPLNLEPYIIGAETIREIGGVYHFTPEYQEQEHYAITFFKKLLSIANIKINFLLNYFSN
jgi:hypothetical protein